MRVDDNRAMALAGLAHLVAREIKSLDAFLSLARLGKLPAPFIRQVEMARHGRPVKKPKTCARSPDCSFWSAAADAMISTKR